MFPPVIIDFQHTDLQTVTTCAELGIVRVKIFLCICSIKVYSLTQILHTNLATGLVSCQRLHAFMLIHFG